MKETNWYRGGASFGGEALTSRATGKKIAATDHCVAIIRTCPACHEKYVARPNQPEHGCAV